MEEHAIDSNRVFNKTAIQKEALTMLYKMENENPTIGKKTKHRKQSRNLEAKNKNNNV